MSNLTEELFKERLAHLRSLYKDQWYGLDNADDTTIVDILFYGQTLAGFPVGTTVDDPAPLTLEEQRRLRDEYVAKGGFGWRLPDESLPVAGPIRRNKNG